MPTKITGHTELIGLLAQPARHSKSPEMQNEAFRELSLDYVYLSFEVNKDTLADAVRGIRAMKLRGSNVSMPNKTAVRQYLDRLSPAAELCGAVNTIVNDDGVLTGHITDGIGFMSSVADHDCSIIGKKITLVGAGGAATAILAQAALDGVAEISVFNIRDAFYSVAEQKVLEISAKTECKIHMFDLDDLAVLRREIESSVLLVNATAMGMKPLEEKACVPDPSYLRSDLVVMDIVYFPKETAFLKMAKSIGCKTISGLSMMLFQGAASFRLWTGKEMPISHMKQFLDIRS